MGLNPKGPCLSLEKEKENFWAVLTYFVKRVIRKFYVAILQWRLRNVHKSVMHVQSCFSDINHWLFSCSLCRNRRRCLSSLLLWSRNCASMVTWRRTSLYRAFSRDVTTAILVFQNMETAAMLVYQDNPVGIELFSYVKNFLLFQWISIDAGHVSENALLTFCLKR